MKVIIYSLLRATVFLLLPVYFYFRPFMPQPVQTMLLGFIVAVLLVEIIRFFFSTKKFPFWFYALPLLATLAAIFPYLSDLEYFEPAHVRVVFLQAGIALIYLLVSWIEQGKARNN